MPLDQATTRLTAQTKAGGCASKLAPGVLERILKTIPPVHDPSVLVGFDHNDDAGVYQLTPDLAIVQTVDFFTPMVDDPFTFGQIAAANALSDVYAMGARPLTALSVLACPAGGDMDVIGAVVRGGADKMREAGAAILGGHSVNDEELKFGYAVTGLIHPDRVKANAGARPGDALLFTKRIGTGVISTALKRGIARDEDVQEAIASMIELNRAACEAMLRFDVHGCTDVTGFGLVAHAREMALASGVTVEIHLDALRFLPGALDYVRQGAIPGGLKNNREFAYDCVEYARTPDPDADQLLYDPQTSGGLLIAMAESDAAAFEQTYPQAYRLGSITPRGRKPVRIN
jgi:selenide,water dikinase